MADIDQLSVSITASADQATAAIDSLTNSLVNLRSKLGRLSTKSFTNSLDKMSASAGNLTQSVGGINVAVRHTSSGLGLWSSSASKAAKHSISLASAIGKVYATYWMLFRAFGMIRKSIDIASDLTEVQNVVDHSFKQMRKSLDNFIGEGGVNVMKDYGITELEAKKVASRFMSMGSNMDITAESASNMSIELTKLAADMASFYNEDFETAAEKLNSVFTGQTRPLILAA